MAQISAYPTQVLQGPDGSVVVYFSGTTDAVAGTAELHTLNGGDIPQRDPLECVAIEWGHADGTDNAQNADPPIFHRQNFGTASVQSVCRQASVNFRAKATFGPAGLPSP